MHMQQHGGHGPQRPQYAHPQHPTAPQMGMINPAQDGLSLSGQPSYQQPLYLQPQDHPVHSAYGGNAGGAPSGNYLIQQSPGGQQRLLMMQPASMMPPQQHGSQHPQQNFGRSPQRASPPGTTTSEDSDDSATPHHAAVMGSGGPNTLKRPSPEPAEAQGMLRQMSKKPKVQKKKKKRDPNEPQKPVSAYALFFRDTQAAIKGQNPNASFGEVSKIVASMWDGLDSEHKNVYKQKTETAKKEYLKALAAYRASLVSKGGNEQESGNMYGSSGSTAQNSGSSSGQYGSYYSPGSAGQGYSPQGHAPPGQSPPPHHMGPPHAPHPAHHHLMQQHSYMHHQVNPANQLQPINSPHRSPQHHSLMGAPQSLSPQLQQLGPKSQGAPLSAHSGQQPISAQALQIPGPMGPQAHPISTQGQMLSPSHHQQAQNLQSMQSQARESAQANMQGQNNSQSQLSPQHQQQQQINQQQNHNHNQQHSQQQQHIQNHQQNQMQNQPQANSNNQSPPASSGNSSSAGGGASQMSSPGPQPCIRHGCTNPAVSNSEWEDEYCSNECVVSHCRDVFTSWVASNNNQTQNFSTVK